MADGSSARDAARQLAAAAGTRNASNYLSREVEDDYDEVNVSFRITIMYYYSAGLFLTSLGRSGEGQSSETLSFFLEF